MKLFLVLFFLAITIFAQENTCKDFCVKCQDDSSELCLQIMQSCECSTSSEPTAATSIPLTNVDFGTTENGDQKFSPLTTVDFGGKGDNTHTAVRHDDGTYELQNKNRTLIIVGSIVLTILVGVIIGNAI
jgi:hypothetical protein